LNAITKVDRTEGEFSLCFSVVGRDGRERDDAELDELAGTP
jgi:hypothetical protein